MAGIIDALARFFSPPPFIDPGTPLDRVVFMGPDDSRSVWNDIQFGEDASAPASGQKVDIESSLTIIAVQSAIRLLTNDIGSLPADALRKTATGNVEQPKPNWMLVPSPLNANLTWEDHIKQVVFSLLTDGNAFTYCLPNVIRAQEIRVLDPSTVQVETAPDGSVTYKVEKADRVLTPDDLIHIPWVLRPGQHRGINPIEAAREGLGIALAADKYVGSYFGNGATLSGTIEFPVGAEPAPAALEQLKKDFAKKHIGARKSHAVGALTGGAQFKPISVNNRDSQLLELRESVVEEVARLFGIPPHMLGSQRPGAVSYASVEQRSIDYTQHAVLPIVSRIERGYGRLFRSDTDYIKFNLNGLLRADSQARATFYREMLQNKVLRRDEVRSLEDYPPSPDAEGYLETPNNNAPDPRFEAVGALIRAGFDPAESLAAVGLPPITHTGKLPVTVQREPEAAPAPQRSIEVHNHVQPSEARVEVPITVQPAEAHLELVNNVQPAEARVEVVNHVAPAEVRVEPSIIPAPVVNVAAPQPATVRVDMPRVQRRVVRDADGNITEIIEE